MTDGLSQADCPIAGAAQNFTSGNKASFIPSISVRYKDFLVSGSYFAKKDYGFTGDTGTFHAKRSETDLLVGYYVLPTLALTVGHKSVKQDFGTANLEYSGPTIGVVASAPLTKGFSLYGNFAYGFMDAKLPGVGADWTGKTKLDADYYLSEVGVAYSFDIRDSMPSVKALTASLGYRSQVLATKDYKLGLDMTHTHNRGTDLRDTTEGLAFGLSASF